MMLRPVFAARLLLVAGLLACSAREAVSQQDRPRAETQPRTIAAATSPCERVRASVLADVEFTDVATVPVIERPVYGPEPRVEHVPLPHCRVVGQIDRHIRFELLLPDAWNGKFIMGGGGGFVGAIDNHAQGGMSAGPTPLERGYATAGTDTGHSGSPIDASWALDDPEARENFAGRAVHRTVEISKKIVADYYDEDLEYSYFLGCSRGGGQAMISVQRYPRDFDGVIAGAPALDWPGVAAAFVRNQQLIYPDPNDLDAPVITTANRRLLARSILERCDTNDGVADGILDDPRECDFDPDGLPKCESGAEPDCLTETQLAAIRAIYGGTSIAGEQVYPGYPFGGEAVPGDWDMWITRPDPDMLPPGVPNLQFAYGTEFFRYFIYNDPEWSYLGYNFEDWQRDSAGSAALLNSTETDLSEYRDSGGKIIMWQGWSDAGVNALDTIEYYESVEQADPDVRDYFRLFMMPGVSHCEGGPGPDYADWISAIEQWTEHGKPPQYLIATKRDDEDNVLMQRPLCPYPQAAKYDGTGDPDVHQSFSCDSPPD